MRAAPAPRLADLEIGENIRAAHIRRAGMARWTGPCARAMETGSPLGDPVFTQAHLIFSTGSPTLWPGRTPDRLHAYAALCAVSFICYIVGRLSGGGDGALFSLVGAGACGWAWLLTRALFDPARRDAWWPRIVAMVIAVTGALSIVGPVDGGLFRFADNAYALSGSAALLLTFIEPLQGRWAEMAPGEKRFRIRFLAVYGLLVAISVLGLQTSNADGGGAYRADLVKSACAVIGLVAGSVAVWFRLRHPLARPDASPPAKRAPTPEDMRLGERLVELLRNEGIDAEPDLRIGDVAARLGQPDYKVSQCISAALGFPNFNRLINHHRIQRAKRLLADPDQDRPILEIAFECGFGSAGPFNRAFKDEVGMTPRAFRATSRRLTDSSHAAQDER